MEYFNKQHKTNKLINVCKTCKKRLNHEYYKRNKEHRYKKNREWVENNKERNREYKREWKKRNPNVDKEYYHKNKTEILLRNKEYRRNHPEEMRFYKRKWKVNNREKVYSLNRQRDAHKQGGSYTTSEWDFAQSFFDNKCAYCRQEAPNLTQDHFIPLSKGGPYVVGNIIPACGACNSSKHNSHFEEWYKSKPFYDPENASKIINYLKRYNQT